MHVRFRQAGRRLQVSLVETHRAGRRVINRHVAGLGSIAPHPTVADRLEFWRRLHDRLPTLAARIGPEDGQKMLARVMGRLPLVSLAELAALRRGLEVSGLGDDWPVWDGGSPWP